MAGALEWAEPVPFDEETAREAATVRAELLDRGEPIPAPDTLITGVARPLGGELIACDDHVSRVSGLEFHEPRA